MKNTKIKRKNGLSKYVIGQNPVDVTIAIIMWLLLITIIIYVAYVEEKIFIMVFGILCFALFFSLIMYILIFPHFIIDFDKEYIIIGKVKYQLKDIIEITYMKSDYFSDKIKILTKYNVVEFKYSAKSRHIDTEKLNGYPMARKIEEINNKLQEYRKQNNLD